MIKQLTIVTSIVVFSLLWISSEAFATNGYTGERPDWMKTFADPYPVYRFDWAFPLGSASADINGDWVSTGLPRAVSQSRADGVYYSGKYWDRVSSYATVNSFSATNGIGDWLDAIGTGNAVIRYTIREDYSGTGSVDNNDVVELFDNENEWLVMPGSTPGGAYLGLGQGEDIVGLEWSTEFDDEHLIFDHGNAVENGHYSGNVPIMHVLASQDDETLYYTVGATCQLDGSGNQTGTALGKVGMTGGNYYNGYEAAAHNADIIVEFRTYNPQRNTDGPESPYEWLYDASGDMYVPTNGSGSGGDTENERAVKLIGNHPYWVDDDTGPELEWAVQPYGDSNIWRNQQGLPDPPGNNRYGLVSEGIFVDSWRLAGELLGDEFWTGGDVWDPTDMRVEDGVGGAVAGYDELNDFMRWVFDIDALVVEDADGDGEFDAGDDYVLFSVVDDGLYNKYQQWGTGINQDNNAFFDGEYFDGDTIFLYDGTSVTTYFDAGAGIFFGQVSSGGAGAALWGGSAYYDIDALDIAISEGIIPEPSTIFLMIGSASGLAVVAGFMRRKLR
ncbi:MAG: PEP-CTERM sorting domain-containing protein [Planctomycetota bacterium]